MLYLKRYLRNNKGFTMIEMMVVLIIIAVLIAGGIRFYSGYINKSRVTKAESELSIIQAALDAYYAEKDQYPVNDTELGDAGIDTSKVKKITSGGTVDGNYKYNYAPVDDTPKTYVITTTAKQGDVFVYATGKYGKIEKEPTTTSSSAQTTAPSE